MLAASQAASCLVNSRRTCLREPLGRGPTDASAICCHALLKVPANNKQEQAFCY
jgi:hypothetical protein